MSSQPTHIGERIRNRRLDLRLKQTELAQRARVHPSSLNQIEKGRRTPDTATLERIARALGQTLSQLMDGVTSSAAPPYKSRSNAEHQRPEENEPTDVLPGIEAAVSAAINRALAELVATLTAALGEWHATHALTETRGPATGAAGARPIRRDPRR